MEYLVIDKLVDGEIEVENELDIANCLNRSSKTRLTQWTICERSKYFSHRS